MKHWLMCVFLEYKAWSPKIIMFRLLLEFSTSVSDFDPFSADRWCPYLIHFCFLKFLPPWRNIICSPLNIGFDGIWISKHQGKREIKSVRKVSVIEEAMTHASECVLNAYTKQEDNLYAKLLWVKQVIKTSSYESCLPATYKSNQKVSLAVKKCLVVDHQHYFILVNTVTTPFQLRQCSTLTMHVHPEWELVTYLLG